ncbi:beta-glucosidase [Sphingomonas sp. NFR15]|uniref:beta-glucosidase family protein n=1 Tax=Sphingomonas sp. NFR15 TaxID=1566282 RepID=UPI000B83C81F|nr:glycoside hydrolase family 3 C-terminal domain-containing protein [Sphingomonas sp. NFR15]
MGSALSIPAVSNGQANSPNDPDARAAAVERQMTDAERVTITHGIMAIPYGATKLPEGLLLGAGYVEGIPRLGVPALTETDASLGVSYVGGLRGDGATALPSGLAMGATWNQDLLRRGGETIAGEAGAKGFNVLLAGGINLVRDPRGGRNFEYLGEDPLHSGLLGGAAIAGIQSRHVISTVKHFAINAVETGRQFHNAVIGASALRMSDLLAFEIAIERGNPGAVMCAYNRVNGASACGNDTLLNGVLKHDWGYKGFVMSDWGAVHGLDFALKGLDQQSGAQLDDKLYFGDDLAAAARRDKRYGARLTDMNRRILRSMYAVGIDRYPPAKASIDFAANARVAQDVAEQGIVLLRNRDVLPLTAKAQRIAVIGGYADSGVLSGGGSSQVQGVGGPVVAIPTVGGPFAAVLAQSYQRSSPLGAIVARAPKAEVVFRNGRYIADAVAAAKKADVAIVFATQWMTEGLDAPDLSLPDGQDALITAVAEANPNTIVVLETGSQVLMPWLDKTAAVLEAWYPGARGGEAIAAILFGDANPSGRLPVTFPASVDQLPRPKLPGSDTIEPNFLGYGKPGQTLDINYNVEGSDVGYRWFAKRRAVPLFPFGFGLSYTRFEHGALNVVPGTAPVARFAVTNIGKRSGAEVGQVYLTGTPAGDTTRLVGFAKVTLKPGERRVLEVPIDPRLLATWKSGRWDMAAGTYRFAIGSSAADLETSVEASFPARRW